MKKIIFCFMLGFLVSLPANDTNTVIESLSISISVALQIKDAD